MDPALIVGCIAILLTGALILGLIVCALRMRRPQANRKCYLAYIFFTSGWLLYAAIASVARYSEHPILGGFLGVLVFGALGLTGIVMAVLGLVEVKGDPGRTGRAPAIVTLVLAGLMVAGLGFAVVAGAVPRLLGRAGESYSGFGFSIQPPAGWTRSSPSRGGANTVVAFTKPRPDAFLRVLVYKAEPALTDLRVIGEGIKAQNQKASSDFKLVEESAETFGGLLGWSIVHESSAKSGPLIYWYWVHATPTFVYIVVISGPLSERAEILSEGRRAFETFRLK
jgi:hypothetical protein